MFGRRNRDSEFAADLRVAAREGPNRSANFLLYAVALFFVIAIVWASRATLDIVATGQGRVIPSSQVQVVQNLEGGILSEILVKEGETVETNQILLRIDDTGFASTFRENRARYRALRATIARLKAEVVGKNPVFPSDLDGGSVDFANEKALFRARKKELDSALAILRRQEDQRKQELLELDTSRVKRLEEGLVLATEELNIIKPMVEKGVTARVELIRLMRQINDLKGELKSARLQVPGARAALAEAQRRIEEKRAAFRRAARAELNESEVRSRSWRRRSRPFRTALPARKCVHPCSAR